MVLDPIRTVSNRKAGWLFVRGKERPGVSYGNVDSLAGSEASVHVYRAGARHHDRDTAGDHAHAGGRAA